MSKIASYWIKTLNLKRHPEGGHYAEVYRSKTTCSTPNGTRNHATAIYFLLEKEECSAFHKIASDEMWHFYDGGPLNIYFFDHQNELQTLVLGKNPEKGEVLIGVIPAGCWFASSPAEGSAYCLAGCTVSPGFDFEDFQLANSAELIKQFPSHTALITAHSIELSN